MDDRIELGVPAEHSTDESEVSGALPGDTGLAEDPRPPLSGRGTRDRRAPNRGPKVFTESAGTATRGSFTPAQRLLMLDTWQRSGLAAAEFGAMVGGTGHTLYQWKNAFDRHGPAGLSDRPNGPMPGSRLAETTRRAIVGISPASCMNARAATA